MSFGIIDLLNNYVCYCIEVDHMHLLGLLIHLPVSGQLLTAVGIVAAKICYTFYYMIVMVHLSLIM